MSSKSSDRNLRKHSKCPAPGVGTLPDRSHRVRLIAMFLVLSLSLAPALWAQRTKLKPGVNMFSVDQDVQIGAENAKQAEQQLAMINDPAMLRYLNTLGKKLSAVAPGPKFDYTFRLVNDKNINAFALPGGFLFVNRGVIEAADNEAQMAGVMAHEIGHAALRHGTNQATKQAYTQGILGIAGGLFGGGSSIGALATQLGASFGAGSILLKFSRDAERQADLVGTQILYDSGYDPRAMAQFFEKLSAESKKSGRMVEFFSSHPNPENRSANVTKEIDKLGGAPPNYRTTSSDFQRVKSRLLAMPAPPKAGKGETAAKPSGGGPPARPSTRMQNHQGSSLRIDYPDNWQVLGASSESTDVTFAPEGGIVQDSSGRGSLAYGFIVGAFEPQADRQGNLSLESATDQFIQSMQKNNPRMTVDQRRSRTSVDGEQALVTYFQNDSPVGGLELGILVTTLRQQGITYFVGVSPEKEYSSYEETFRAMIRSVRFRR